MKLNQVQIQELYKFTRAHFVEHYDLQTELVDHLANGIELQWKQNSGLSFEQAKQKEFKKFGVFGFMDVVAARRKALSKRYWKIIFRFYKEWFQFPKVLLTVCLTILAYLFLDQINPEQQSFYITGILLLGLMPMLFYTIKSQRMLKKKDKKWMLEELLLNQSGAFNILMLPIHFWNINFIISSSLGLVLTSFAIVAFLVLSYVITFVVPLKAEELLLETYPEYKIS